MSMSVNERKSILDKWVIEAKRLHLTVMVQIGGTTTQDVLELAKHASEQNVDAVLCLPQLYIKPQTEVELVKYLSLVAGNCPQIPLFYYHIPKYTGVNCKLNFFYKIYLKNYSFLCSKYCQSHFCGTTENSIIQRSQRFV